MLRELGGLVGQVEAVLHAADPDLQLVEQVACRLGDALLEAVLPPQSLGIDREGGPVQDPDLAVHSVRASMGV